MRIVHIHLPKTAGTALRTAFQNLASPKIRVCPATYEAQFKDLNFADYDFFSGHISFALAQKIGGDYITVMRNPIDRFLSVYYFWRELYDKGVEKSRNTFLARHFDLSEFAKFFDEPTLTEEFFNRITWQLAFSSATQQRTVWRQQNKLGDSGLLDLAKENLAKFKIIGFQERYDSVVDKINSAYGLNIKNNRVNVTGEREDVSSLSPEVAAQISRWVYLDNELYNYALEQYGQNSGEPKVRVRA